MRKHVPTFVNVTILKLTFSMACFDLFYYSYNSSEIEMTS